MRSDGHWCGDGDVMEMVNGDVTGTGDVVVAGAVSDPEHSFTSP